MRPKTEGNGWDITPILSLLNSLSSREAAPAQDDKLIPSLNRANEPDFNVAKSTPGLGDFSKLWDYLGQPHNVPPPTLDSEGSLLRANDELGFEGLIDVPPGSKGVRWRDELDGADLVTKNDHLGRDGTDKPQNKRQQRKAAQRLKQGKQVVQPIPARKQPLPQPNFACDTESNIGLLKLRTPPAQKASLHEVNKSVPTIDQNCSLHYSSSPPSSVSPLKCSSTVSPYLEWPVSNPVRPQSADSLWEPPKSHIEPLLALSSPNRKAKLTQDLIRKFEAEREALMNPIPLNSSSNATSVNSCGLHVFVDASNIMIGFHDTMKRARGIPVSRYIRQAPFSFHSLALIMERGRPTAKRVLVGSSPHVPAFDEAKKMGYETSILDKVHKAKELTPRQRKYRSGYGTSGASSGSETTAAYAPEKWVEQAVDEILHLKILESLVDAAEPSTIVLATGDAAEAEYSQGFLRMVERALEKGWSIELVSFAQSISFAYRRKEFRQKWGKRFQIIELDQFCEELLAL